MLGLAGNKAGSVIGRSNMTLVCFRVTKSKQFPFYFKTECMSVTRATGSLPCRNNSSSHGGTEDIAAENQTDNRRGSRNRTRRRRLSLNGDSNDANSIAVPSYKDFVHKFTVVSMYRNYLKCIRSIGEGDELSTMKADLLCQVKHEFHSNKKETDQYAIQRALQEGERRYQELQHMVPTNKSTTGSSSSSSLQYLEEDSWLNINDPEDRRGRVGQGWPWETKDEDQDSSENKK